MVDYCNVTVLGNVTKDFEVKKVEKEGKEPLHVVNFSVAVNEGKDKGATYLKCVLYGEERCRVFYEQAQKGTQVLVSGRLKLDKFEFNGESRTEVSIVVSWVQCTQRTKKVSSEVVEAQEETNSEPSLEEEAVHEEDFEEVDFEEFYENDF